MLKINFLRNVHKADLKVGFKISRVLILFWRISLKTRFSRISYTLNQHIYDIHHISFNKIINFLIENAILNVNVLNFFLYSAH